MDNSVFHRINDTVHRIKCSSSKIQMETTMTLNKREEEGVLRWY